MSEEYDVPFDDELDAAPEGVPVLHELDSVLYDESIEHDHHIQIGTSELSEEMPRRLQPPTVPDMEATANEIRNRMRTRPAIPPPSAGRSSELETYVKRGLVPDIDEPPYIVEIDEETGEHTIMICVPGLHARQIEVFAEPDRILVTTPLGSKFFEEMKKSWRVPGLDVSSVSAKLKAGVLTITSKRRSDQKARTVRVTECE